MPTLDEEVTPAMPKKRCIKIDDLWTECLWALPKFDEQNCHPFQFKTIKHYQRQSLQVMELPAQAPQIFQTIPFGKTALVCLIHPSNKHLIVIPEAMLPCLIT